MEKYYKYQFEYDLKQIMYNKKPLVLEKIGDAFDNSKDWEEVDKKLQTQIQQTLKTIIPMRKILRGPANEAKIFLSEVISLRKTFEAELRGIYRQSLGLTLQTRKKIMKVAKSMRKVVGKGSKYGNAQAAKSDKKLRKERNRQIMDVTDQIFPAMLVLRQTLRNMLRNDLLSKYAASKDVVKALPPKAEAITTQVVGGWADVATLSDALTQAATGMKKFGMAADRTLRSRSKESRDAVRDAISKTIDDLQMSLTEEIAKFGETSGRDSDSNSILKLVSKAADAAVHNATFTAKGAVEDTTESIKGLEIQHKESANKAQGALEWAKKHVGDSDDQESLSGRASHVLDQIVGLHENGLTAQKRVNDTVNALPSLF
jgi:hypothetical protein